MIINLEFIQLEIDSYIYIRYDIIMKVYIDDIKIVDSIIIKYETIYKELT